LDRLAKAHLVGQDAVEVVVEERHQPLQTLELVVVEALAWTEHLGLLANLLRDVVCNLVVARLLVVLVGLECGLARG